MGDYFYWFSLGTALALIGLVILSVVFAPIAVATCVVIARVRGLPALQHESLAVSVRPPSSCPGPISYSGWSIGYRLDH